MNIVILMGNICKDIEVRQTGNVKFVQNTVAVQRDFKNPNGTYDTDFIQFVAFGTTAEFLAKYFKKGSRVLLTGSFNTSTYTKENGEKQYTSTVKVSKVEFGDTKKSQEETKAQDAIVASLASGYIPQPPTNMGVTETKEYTIATDPNTIPTTEDEDLPF